MPRLSFAMPRSWNTWLTVAATCIPLLAGVGVSLWHARRAMDADAQAQTRRVLKSVEWMLGNAAQTAARVGPRAGERCDGVVLELRKQVDSVLFVRSVDLLSGGNTIYCSSLYGALDRVIDAHAYVDGQLRIVPHSGTYPDSTLLSYRWVEDGRGAIVTIDGRHVRDVLSLVAHNGVKLFVEVGGVRLGATGLADGAIDSAAPALVLNSTTFPVAVRALLPAGELGARVFADYSGLIAVCAILSLLLGISVKRGLDYVSSRRFELMRALRLGEFVPYFQPLVNASDGAWIGAEVLIRWHHPREGMVAPDSFIPLAESSGLIVPVTRQLFESVAALLAGVALPDGFRLSLNVSAQHMKERSIVSDCEALQQALGTRRVQLVLEITERELLTWESGMGQIFEALHARGIQIAVDDFGTGHSGFAYLRDFAMDALKVDRTFVARIGTDAASERVLESILDLAAKLDMTTVAEGVETRAQSDYLRECGVPVLQGFLFGRPMPVDEFVARLHERCDAGVLVS